VVDSEQCLYYREDIGEVTMYNKIFKFAVSISVCEFAGIIGSVFTASTLLTWYSTLIKPDFSPPGWLFGPVWISLYFLMGISLYLIWQKKAEDKNKSLIIFGIQLILNVFWSFLFFGLKSPLYGLINILFLLVAIGLTIAFSYRISFYAAIFLIPYLVWVCFATILNYAILSLNYR
jgi:translocator protein